MQTTRPLTILRAFSTGESKPFVSGGHGVIRSEDAICPNVWSSAAGEQIARHQLIDERVTMAKEKKTLARQATTAKVVIKKTTTKKATTRKASAETAEAKIPVAKKAAPKKEPARKQVAQSGKVVTKKTRAAAPGPVTRPPPASPPAESAPHTKPAPAPQPPLPRDEKPASPGPASVNPEQRLAMIEEAAYYKAEKRNFASGFEAEDWAEAEREIDEKIAKQ
jgi:hypothetical protein